MNEWIYFKKTFFPSNIQSFQTYVMNVIDTSLPPYSASKALSKPKQFTKHLVSVCIGCLHTTCHTQCSVLQIKANTNYIKQNLDIIKMIKTNT